MTNTHKNEESLPTPCFQEIPVCVSSEGEVQNDNQVAPLQPSRCTPFDGMVFSICGSFSMGHKLIQKLLVDHGAKVTANVSNKVTHFLTSEVINQTDGNVSAQTSTSQKLNKAIARNITIVSEDWVHEQIARAKMTSSENLEFSSLQNSTTLSSVDTAAKSKPKSRKATSTSFRVGSSARKKQKIHDEACNILHSTPVMEVREDDVLVDSVCLQVLPKNGTKPALMKYSGHYMDVFLFNISGVSDKYYLIQGIVLTDLSGSTKDSYYIFTRWGRTGTSGQSNLFGPLFAFDEAVKIFDEKFREKTGNSYITTVSDGTFQSKPGMYHLLIRNTNSTTQAAISSGVKWEYYVHDNVCGKANGWYPYDDDCLMTMESIYTAYIQNPYYTATLRNRLITSNSSSFTYAIDLHTMTQVNTETQKVRNLRRVSGDGIVTTSQSLIMMDVTPSVSSSEMATYLPLSSSKPVMSTLSQVQSSYDEIQGPQLQSQDNKLPDISTSAAKAPLISSSSSSSLLNPPSSLCFPPNTESMLDDSCGTILLDPSYPHQNASVHCDYDCMLNQVNIGHNNNKFYKMQLVHDTTHSTSSSLPYVLFTRWGRVGEVGMSQTKYFPTSQLGEKAFATLFRSKTGNSWEKRQDFVKKNGKYALLHMDNSTNAVAKVDALNAKFQLDYDKTRNPNDDNMTRSIENHPKQQENHQHIEEDYYPSQLDDATQDFIRLIFSDEMFHNAMAAMKIDTRRLPLGALTRAGISAGMDVLAQIEEVIEAGTGDHNTLQRLCSDFYTLIPHAFTRNQVPPLLTTKEAVQQKFDMLNVMLDIEDAQSMVKEGKKTNNASETHLPANPVTTEKVIKPNPVDEKYKTLQAELTLLDTNSQLYHVVSTYANETMSRNWKVKLLNVWSVNRDREHERFSQYDSIRTNRKLLWHGTNCAVVASCLKSGLRIMPHSGGRVGKGIYLASEHGKSSAYTRPGQIGRKGQNSHRIGVMFLVEAALGVEYHILHDDSSLRAPPQGSDSIVAIGKYEPDPTQDTLIFLDSHQVTVPQGKPIPMSRGIGSSFEQTEYLIYNEAQHRIRFVCTFEF